MGSRYGRFAPYITVAERRQLAEKAVTQLKKKGKILNPVIVDGRCIANTFWGKAWCENLETYSDFSNRLPRGRSYVRHGAVIDLQVKGGEISALVNGSSLYSVKVSITILSPKKWKHIIEECSGKIDSLIELLQGKFSKSVMEIITRPEKGLFPHPKEIKLACSCPDGAYMCKHIAAVLYAIGARLDQSPEELFLLRQVNQLDLIAELSATTLTSTKTDSPQSISDADLSELFGIEIEEEPRNEKQPRKPKTKKALPTKKANRVQSIKPNKNSNAKQETK